MLIKMSPHMWSKALVSTVDVANKTIIQFNNILKWIFKKYGYYNRLN